MSEKRRFLQKLRGSLGDFLRWPMAQQQGARRWTLLGMTGVLALFFLGFSAMALAALGSGAGVTVSSNPSFCNNCHEIQPAYDQWRVSSHREVNCLTCHTDEGLSGYLEVNVTGLSNVTRHLSGAVDLPVQSSVKSDNCLACHPGDSLPETMPQATLKIAHSAHRDQSCTACHVRLVHPRLFEPWPVPVQVSSRGPKDCSVCHESPKPAYLHGDAEVACSSCHSGNIPNHDLAVRRNTPLRETCKDCHTQQRVSQPESCQTCHVGPHGADLNCAQCHSPTQTWGARTFSHPVALAGTHGQLKCTQCHVVLQSSGAQALSAENYLCSTCHAPKHAPMDDNCTKCHQPTAWKSRNNS